VQATVALYTGSYRLSKRTTQQTMDDVFGVPMSVGTISPLERAPTEVLAGPVDETSWRQGVKRAWLWVAVTSWVTGFLVCLARGSQVARELLGEMFSGILVTDRYSAYNWYPVRWRPLCWAHVLRDFEAMRGRGGRSEEMGDAVLAQAHQMFTWWHRVREGTLKRSSFRSYKCLYKNIFMHYHRGGHNDILRPIFIYGDGFTSLSAQGGTQHACDSYKS
jgi:transposase